MSKKKNSADGDIRPVYVICGKEQYLVNDSCQALLDRLLPKEQRSMALYQPLRMCVQSVEIPLALE